MHASLTDPRRACSRGILLAAIAGIVCACGSKTESTGPAASTDPAAQSTDMTQSGAPAEVAPPVPAPAVTQASWAPDALEELLAPIALYPDQLLGQILAASVNSQEVLDAGNWLLQNENLKGNELDAAAQKAGFGPAMRSLVQFPTVVDMLCQQIDWTRQVGSAFSSDQAAVLDAVQRLRMQAQETGNLKSTKEQKVETKTENSKVVVEVKPADPQIVYVPTYNPQTVYTTPPPATTTTTVVHEEDTVSTGAAVAGGLIAFGLGVIIGNEMNDDYYPHWGYGSVYYGPRPFYPPAYVYRPVYGPAFRPAYGYASPPGYRYNYNNVNIRNDVNININNDYFNRFDNNQNLRGNTNSPLRPTQQPRVGQTGGTQRVGQTGGTQRAGQAKTAESWKGQSTYQGAKNPATAERLNQAAGGRASTDQSRDLGASGGSRNPALAQTQQREQPVRTQYADRGYGGSSRTDAREHTPTRDLSGATASQRPATQHAAPERRDNAFSGAHREGGGSFDRAASTRGHASAGHARSGGGRRR